MILISSITALRMGVHVKPRIQQIGCYSCDYEDKNRRTVIITYKLSTKLWELFSGSFLYERADKVKIDMTTQWDPYVNDENIHKSLEEKCSSHVGMICTGLQV